MPADADAPPDLLTPFTARPAASASRARRFERRDRRDVGIDQIEIGTIADQQGRIGKAGETVVGRHPRHRHRALGEARDAGARQIVGRDDGLFAPDEDAQAEIVAFGALGFLDRAVADLDRKRDGTHGHRVGGVGARRARRRDQALGDIGQGGLIEQEGHCRNGFRHPIAP